MRNFQEFSRKSSTKGDRKLAIGSVRKVGSTLVTALEFYHSAAATKATIPRVEWVAQNIVKS